MRPSLLLNGSRTGRGQIPIATQYGSDKQGKQGRLLRQEGIVQPFFSPPAPSACLNQEIP
ncbi:hypothetical protein [Nostoc sp. ChiVER01]|uniref:hypothetical protein n=1 Tax=Nostoc sp. ChiVER01 TaxID=3075382 RepID=UPI002AD59740|nr:hypothetical protein [Nostoc sp. ChiVER01]MDZ8222125.1 hypothetical protein [Nostoc sp. ChiVER01]